MRKRPGTPPEVDPIPPATVIRQERKYQLITPLYGGGVTSAEPDPITIVRATEIRGHLRFWWRACRGGQYGTLEAIKQAEDALWGTAGTKQGGGPSQVQIEVAEYAVDEPHASFNIAPLYAAFPLRQTPNKPLYVGVSFKLIIEFPSAQRQEIEATLRMWEIFGGIGARTRRGLRDLILISVDGVSHSDFPNPTKEEAEIWIQQQLERCVVQGTYPPGLPHLTHSTMFKITPSEEDVMDVWHNLIMKLASFRQARRGGPRGRSYWPEPEAIRTITGERYDERHPPLNHPTKFPRAAFGLPIIFHFKYSNRGEPPDTTLEGRREESRRFASPLILRPLVCGDNRAVGVALLLEGSRIPPPGGIILDYDPTSTVDTQLTPTEARAIPVLHGQTDVLQAFMNYL